MVVVLKKDITADQKNEIRDFLKTRNFKINEIQGEEETVIAAVGRSAIDVREVEILKGVQKVIPISKPYKLASREFKRSNTVAEITSSRGQVIKIGGQRIAAIAGPCAVESREQIMEIARQVSSSGAVLLRGGCYKPRTSPYSFQGLGEEGLKYLKEAGDKYGLPVVTEISSENYIPVMKDMVDVFQIGSRNMQNFDLLKKVGALGKPVILKRSYTATLEELLMSAEYLLSSGTDNVILCERGIRTFENATKNTLDLSAIPVLRSLTHLPVITDPSTIGYRDKILPMALASVAAGADGVMVEVHNHPEKALCDGVQSLLPSQFDKLMHDIEALSPVVGKSVVRIREEKPSVVSLNSSDANSRTDSTLKNAGKTICAYSGKKGAYAEQAITRYFDSEEVEEVAVDSFDQIFRDVIDGKADYGMVPIENSLAGSVYQNYDNFSRFEDVVITGAVTLNIRHSLLAVKGAKLEDIKTVYSHPQALAQCKKFLDDKNWTLVDAVSTATAAQMVGKMGSRENAAIGSAVNASLYNLQLLAEDIENDPGNFTRFVVIQASHGKEKAKVNVKPNIASFMFTVKSQPGALYNILGSFREFNLTKLESRPLDGQPWKYRFYVDIELNDIKDNVNDAVYGIMEKLKEKTEDLRLLGVYSEARY